MVVRRLGRLTVALPLLLALNACSPPAQSTPKTSPASGQPSASAAQTPPPPAAPTKLRVIVLPYLSNGPLLIALNEGYFAEQGLEIERIAVDQGPRTLPLLVGGDYDVYGGSFSTGMINLIARGQKIRVVADKGHVVPGDKYMAMVARRDLVESGELKTPADLRGRRFAGSPATTLEYYADCLCASGGVKADEIKYTYIENPLLEQAFRTKAIDLYVSAEPWTSRLQAAGVAVPWHTPDVLLPGLQYSILAYGPNLLEKNPEAGRKFMVGYVKGIRRYNAGKTESNIAILARETQLSPELLKQAAWPCLRSDGVIDTDSLANYQQWAVERKLIDRPIKVEEFWDPAFVNYANQVLGSPGP